MGLLFGKTTKKTKSKIIMTKRALNLYEMIFGAFFILKITKFGIVAGWHWFYIFLPLIIGFIHKFFVWVYEGTLMRQSLDDALENLFIDFKTKRFANKKIKEMKKDLSKKH